MYNVHALEKGLARNHDLRPGFGRKALSDLNDALVIYLQHDYPANEFAYQQGVSVIQRYSETMEAIGQGTEMLHELVDPCFLSSSDSYRAAGTTVIKRSDKLANYLKDFYSLAQGRSSVREFSGEGVESDKVRRALQNATKTPSVCNRQGWSVYWIEDKELAAEILGHQRGFGYKQMPEILLIITVSNNVFLSPVERNEAFVDGGLFAMSVMYGLEHEGLAAVPLNAMMYARDQRAVRNLADIADAEMIIMFIAIGSFPESSHVPISDRRPASEFIKQRGKPKVYQNNA